MASKIYGATGLTGGGSGAMDSIVYSTLADGDMCIAIVGGATDAVYTYTWDSASAAAESSPDVIRSDTDAGGAGRWILTSGYFNDIVTSDDVIVGDDLTVAGDAAITGALTSASLELGGAGAVCTGILDEDNMATDSAVKLCTQQSIKAYVDGQVAGITVSYDFLAGYVKRPIFTWSSVTAIKIKAGRYHTKAGAQSEGIHKWDSELTFTFESGGSNAASVDFSGNGSTWFYLYLDESSFADSGATLLTNANFVANDTAPTWDADELAWYNGNDRCIAAFYVNSSEELDVFWHDGRYIQYDDSVESYADAYPGTDFSTAVTLHAPSFATAVMVAFDCYAPGGTSTAHHLYRTTGSSGTGLQVGRSFLTLGDNWGYNTLSVVRVICSSGQSIDVKVDYADSDNRLGVDTLGYFLPEGM